MIRVRATREVPSPIERPCLVCGALGTAGARILGSRLCDECQAAITCLEARDDEYGFFVAKIKEVWRPFFDPQAGSAEGAGGSEQGQLGHAPLAHERPADGRTRSH